MDSVPLPGPSSFSSKQGTFPKHTGPNVVTTTAVPALKNFSDLCTLFTPRPPPRTCCEYNGLTMYRRGPTQRISGSCPPVSLNSSLTRRETNLSLDRICELCIPLDSKMKDTLLVLVLQQTVHNERQLHVPVLHDFPRDVFENEFHPCPRLHLSSQQTNTTLKAVLT